MSAICAAVMPPSLRADVSACADTFVRPARDQGPTLLKLSDLLGIPLWVCDGSMITEDHKIEVSYIDGEAYEIAVRGHRIAVDQPPTIGGKDTAPTPTELLVGSLASCVAFYAGRYLTRHGYDRTGLSVSASYELATDRPARVSAIRIGVKVPTGLPEQRRPAFAAVIRACTVHTTLDNPPEVQIVMY